MPKAQRDLNSPLPFPNPEDSSLDSRIREALAGAIRRSNLSIEQIAEGMSRRLGFAINHHVLYSYCSAAHPKHRFPVLYVPAFCQETGDKELLRIVNQAMGLHLPEPGDAARIALAKQLVAAHVAQKEAEASLLAALQKGLLR
jgi:hypothetical protein